MSTASGDEATSVTEVNESVAVVTLSAGETAADDARSRQSSHYTTASEEGTDPSESGGPTIVEENEQNDVIGEDGEGENHEDGDLSEDGSSVAGSSGGSQVPDAEREEGDGQEEGDKKDKKLDHDEDRRDPQYIPKRGVFYEHDDRTLDEDPDVKKELPREPRKSKAEHIERWGHDMYDEIEQSPKSSEELIDAYGYDIRKEEAPPKARRRRRYGKGPNKYQRSWEDEQAYNKTPARGGYRGGQKRSPRNFENRDEDFPSLPGSEPVRKLDSENSPRQPPLPQRDQEPKSPKPAPREDPEMSREEIKLERDDPDDQENRRKLFESRTFWRCPERERNPVKFQANKAKRRTPFSNLQREGREPLKTNQSFNRKHPESFRGGLAVRGRGGARRGRPGNDSVQPFTKSQAHGPNHPLEKHHKVGSTADEDIATLAQHFSNAVINVDKKIAPIRSQSEPPAEDRPRHNAANAHQRHEGHQKHQEKHPPQAHVQEKQMPAEQPSTKSKRYSTQRQRPPTGGQAPPTSAPPPTAQQIPNAPNYLPPQQGYYPPQHGICPPEGPAPHIAAPPAQYQPGVQVVTFLPTVPPPPTNTFQPPPNIYVPPAPYIPPPPIVQPPPAEVYQGGVTYYNTHSQQVTRAAPSRRVKLAIPIVAPDSSQPIQ